MADTPNNWVSYADYLGLTGDESRRLEEEAMQRAQAAENDAMGSLQRAQLQASQRGGQLSGVMPYNDFLAARERVSRAYADAGNIYGHDWRRLTARGAQGYDPQQLANQGAQHLGALDSAADTAAGAAGRSWQGAQDAWSRWRQQSQQRMTPEEQARFNERYKAHRPLNAAQSAQLDRWNAMARVNPNMAPRTAQQASDDVYGGGPGLSPEEVRKRGVRPGQNYNLSGGTT